ncbi:MAG: choice-of-anchor J domain-containing protein [Chitinophagaceae bacterium]|nr:choice-of-anchor J domain-containing protein [Chitinophagaceae bacterium]MCW5904405.1 choice-of-anchor J domain-containing protein [Chitinophagaceae bacterium]
MKKIYLLLVAIALHVSGIVTAQVNSLTEGFNAPSPTGWVAQNLSTNASANTWTSGSASAASGAITPKAGAGFAVINYTAIASGSGTISSWYISPQVNLKDGAAISFYTMAPSPSYPDRLQVRLSVSGASTNAGSSPTDVGDFTILACDVNPTLSDDVTSTGGCGNPYPTTWTKYTIIVSGVGATPVAGRVAFRYFVDDGGPNGNNSNIIGLDEFEYAQAPINNDLAVQSVYSLGKYPVGSAVNSATTAVVLNNGGSTLTNVPVTLSVTGANTHNSTEYVSSLAPGATATLTFSSYAPTNTGVNTLTVSAPSDDNNANNSASFIHRTVIDTIAHFTDSASTGSIGYNTGTGNICAKYSFNQVSNITKIVVSIANNPASVGKSIRGVVFTATGTIIDSTDIYVIQSGDINKVIAIPFITPVPVDANTDYLIGILQLAGTPGYYPIGAQPEVPTRSNIYYSVTRGGGTPSMTNTLNRLMLGAIFSNAATPVTFTSFTGEKSGNRNILSWTTATEANNKGFELQRSVNGIEFSTVTFIPSKAENGTSNVELAYTYTDKASSTNIYYQLKQIDKDGKYAYSNTVVIKGEKPTRFDIVNIYPNPAKDRLSVTVTAPKASQATLTITDMTGKIVMQQNNQLTLGENNISINVVALNTGNYIIKLSCADGCESSIQKFIKQ